MIVDQAVYGGERGGHALLARSGGRVNVPFAALTTRTDLPGTPPPGTSWEPYVSGFPFEGFYILSRTALDRAASRGGMVVTHVLAAPLDEVSELANLEQLLQRLAPEPSRLDLLDQLEIESTGWPDRVAESAPTTAASLELVELLISGAQPPAVWVGQAGFIETIAQVWAGLPPHLRRAFTFRISFGPQDCQDERPTVVCTPASLESRWAGYQLVIPTKPSRNVSGAARLMLRLAEAEPLSRFCSEIGASIARLGDFRLIERCHDLVGRPDLSPYELVEAIRLLGHLSPSAGAASAHKQRLSQLLGARVPSMKASELRLMRNLEGPALPAAAQVWATVENWAAEESFRRVRDEPEITEIWLESASGEATPWRAAVRRGVGRALAAPNRQVALAVWRLWSTGGEHVDRLASLIPSRQETERALAAAAPDMLPPLVADAVMKFAAARSWSELHGVAASAAYDPVTAVGKQLHVRCGSSEIVGIRAALRRATGADVLQAALKWADPRVVGMATDACVREPGLLHAVDVTDPTWRSVFVNTLGKDPDAWRHVSDQASLVDRLVELSTPGSNAPHDAWDALAATPLADLSEYRDQSIYRRLDDRVLSVILAPTADGWLAKFFDRPDLAPPTDARLRSKVCEEHRCWPHLINALPARLEAGVLLFRTFAELGEGLFNRWLTEFVKRTSTERPAGAAAAEMLGKLVFERRWRVAAEQVSSLAKYQRVDLRPALRACYPILGRWEKVAVRFAGALELPDPSPDELWQQLEELAAELYPKGPHESEIWSRADGDGAALEHEGEGRVRWRYAIRKLRNGGGGKIRPAKLLKEMRQDFAWNRELEWLAERDVFRDR